MKRRKHDWHFFIRIRYYVLHAGWLKTHLPHIQYLLTRFFSSTVLFFLIISSQLLRFKSISFLVYIAVTNSLVLDMDNIFSVHLFFCVIVARRSVALMSSKEISSLVPILPFAAAVNEIFGCHIFSPLRSSQLFISCRVPAPDEFEIYPALK